MNIAKLQSPSGPSSTARNNKRRRRKAYPVNPAKVLNAAIYAGLAALVRLASKRANKHEEVQKLCAGIEGMWRKARTDYRRLKKAGLNDFSPILAAEHNMRKNYLGMLWWTTKPYGNREFKRVYSWREGAIGPLNELLNYAGAQLRNHASRYFIFPKPVFYQVREYESGSKDVLHRSTAIRHPPRDAVKTYWIAAYPGNSRYPLVRVRHSTLPELDFVDMIRAHLVELVRQCFIHNVPRHAAQRYIRLLIHRLHPYLEWVYTQGACGRKDFWPEADQVLRKVVLEIRAMYGRRVGRTARLTHRLEYEAHGETTVQLFEKQAQEALKRDSSKKMRRAVSSLRRLIKKKYLIDGDAQEFLNTLLEVSQREGNDWHRILFSGMYQPASLKQAIFAGDKFVTEITDVLVAAEVPVKSFQGSGKADLVVFVRRRVADAIVWTPVMVLDIKTKTGISWKMLGRMPRTKREDTRVPYHAIKKRRLTDSEWESIIEGTPSNRDIEQLVSYEQGLVRAYKTLVTNDSSAPNELWKGIIVLDTDQDREMLFLFLPWLVRSVLSDLKTNDSNSSSRTLYTPNLKGESKKNQPRLGVILAASEGPHSILQSTVPVDSLEEENPFEEREKDNRHFTLYLSVASVGSSGETAAWIARNWHLLHHLSDLTDNEEKTEFVWLDLIGAFAEPVLRTQRLRLFGSQKPRRVSRRQIDGLQSLVNEIGFQDLSGEIEEYFFEDSVSGLGKLDSRFKKIFRKLSGKQRVVVVDGWATLRQIIPPHLDSLVKTLETRLLGWMPDERVEIVWLDRPVPLPVMSSIYQRFKVTPIPYDSPRKVLIDEIIWNLPSSPRNFGWRTPRREDIRLIVQDTPTAANPYVTPFGVPHLRGWARRFRADSSKDRTVSETEVLEATVGDMYGRLLSSSLDFVEVGSESEETMKSDIFDLVPSLCRFRGKQREEAPNSAASEGSSSEISLSSEELGQVVASKGILGRVSFEPDHELQERGRKSTYSPPNKMTRGRIRRTPPETEYFVRTSRKPPVLEDTSGEHLDNVTTKSREVTRVLRTAKFLKRQFEGYDQVWHGLMDSVIKVCMKSGVSPSDVLTEIRDILSTREASKDLWNALYYERSKSGKDAMAAVSGTLENLRRANDEVMTLYGNALFLLVLGVVKKGEPEDWIPYSGTLWKSVADWQLLHMGFRPSRSSHPIAQSRYDTRALWSNLLWRAIQLSSGPECPHLFESEQIGQMIYTEPNNLWLVFEPHPHDRRMVAGMIEDVRIDANLRGFFNTIIDLQRLANEAERILESGAEMRTSIIITRVEGMNLLWAESLDSEAEDEWNLIGNLRYGLPKKGQVGPIRWFRISGVPYRVIARLAIPEGVTEAVDPEKRVDSALKEIVELGDRTEAVKVEVSVDEKKATYLVRLISNNGEPLETLEIDGTEDLRRFLRGPVLSHEDDGLVGDTNYTWDPRTDIIYTDTETERGPLSTSFLKPLVHRRSFLGGRLRLPETARDVLNTEIGGEVLMVTSPEMERYTKGQKRCWRVWFLEADLGERLKSIESGLLTIFDVALLFECRQIVDLETGKRHPATVVVNGFSNVEFPEHIWGFHRITKYLEDRGIERHH